MAKSSNKPTSSAVGVKKATAATPAPLRPFSMSSLLFSTLVFSLIAGGLMTAMNWRRLDKPNRALPIVIVSVILFFLVGGVFAIQVIQPDPTVALFSLVAANAVFAGIVVTWQRPSYALWAAKYGTTSPTLRESGFYSYILVILIAVAALFLDLQVTGIPIGATMLSLRPTQTVNVSGMTISYPGAWVPMHPVYLGTGFCDSEGAECLTNITRLGTLVILGSRRLSGTEYATATPEQLDDQTWKDIQKDVTDLNLRELVKTQIGGRPATRRVYTYPGYPSGRLARIIVFVKETDKTLVQFDLIGEESAVNQVFSEIDGIFRSVRFDG